LIRQAERLLAALPLPVLLPLPTLAGVALAWLFPFAVGRLLAASVAVTLLLGLEVSRQLRAGSTSSRSWTPELTSAAQRTAALERRVAVLEQLSERRRGQVSPETSTTFRLFTQLVNAEEATHAHIAAELHDAVAQTLSQALMELRSGKAEQGCESVRDAEEQLRGVMARIRPPELASGNLAGAVADLCSDLHHRYGVEITVSWPDESIPLAAALATTFYRFVQEALLNATVHADGVDVRLDVARQGQELRVTVSDGGPGFDPAAVVSSEGRHVGLQLARERARLAGGVLEVCSAPGGGTIATLRLPVDDDALVATERV